MISEQDIFPEINSPPYSSQVALLSLKDIGAKSSAEAKKAGYVCIKKQRNAGSKNSPSVWVSQEDYATLEFLATHIAKARMASGCKKSAAEDRRRQGLKEKLLKFVQEKSSQVWDQAAVDSAVQSCIAKGQSFPKSITWLFKMLLSELKWSGLISFDHNIPDRAGLRGQMRLSHGIAEAVLPAPMSDLWPLVLQGNKNALDAHFDTLAAPFVERAELLAKAMPSWLPRQRVAEWCAIQSIKASKGGSVPDAVLPILQAMGKNELRPAGIEKRTGGQLQLGVSVELPIGEKADPLRVRIQTQELCRLLARVTDCDSLASAVQQAESLYQEEFNQLILALPDQVMSGMETDKYRLVLGEETLRQIVEQAIVTVVSENAQGLVGNKELSKRVRKKLRVDCESLYSDFLANQCRDALPSSLPDFYPLARGMKRKLILVVGPTNSGKTYEALQRFRSVESGVYLGPLRLLALEVRDGLLEKGLPTSLVTGEYIENIPEARHTSSTIEMLNFEKPVDVAIIDEIQMLADPQRGSAWLQAVLGAPAKEVWMLGAPESLAAVKSLAEYLGEPLEVIEKERLTPLTIAPAPVPIDEIPSGSALIAFSRRAVLDLAAELRVKHGRNPSIIYGALSPEVRREQARRFRDGESDIVVATDAIALGLNLPVKSVIFTTHYKWDGRQEVAIPLDLTWQIAGRAGRYGMHEAGEVGALYAGTLKAVKAAMSERPRPVAEAFQYSPSWPIVQVLGKHLATEKLVPVLEFFSTKLRLSEDKRFRPELDEERMVVARLLDKTSLPLRAKLSLLGAPIPMFKKELDRRFEMFVKNIDSSTPRMVSELTECSAVVVGQNQEAAELAAKVLTLYCWLHYRHPDIFPDLDAARSEIENLDKVIESLLAEVKGKTCPDCGRKMKWDWRHRLCDPCFQKNSQYDYQY